MFKLATTDDVDNDVTVHYVKCYSNSQAERENLKYGRLVGRLILKVVLEKYRLCGLVVRVSGYRYRGPGFDPRRYQIF